MAFLIKHRPTLQRAPIMSTSGWPDPYSSYRQVITAQKGVRVEPTRTTRRGDPVGGIRLSGLGCECENDRLGLIPFAIPAAGTVVKGVIAAAQALPFVKSLLGGKPSQSRGYWDAYIRSAGSIPGTAYGAKDFGEAWLGMWQANKANYPGHVKYSSSNGEEFKAALADQIVQATVTGKFTNADTAGTIYEKVIGPWMQAMKPNWGIAGENRAMLTQITVDLIDRYIHNIPIARADIPEFQGQGYTISVPLFSAALTKNAPTPTATGTTVPVVPAGPVTPVAPLTPAPSTASDLSQIVQRLTDQFMASAAARSLSEEARVKGATDFALQSLQASGVQPTAEVKAITTETVTRQNMPGWFLPAAIGASIIILGLRTRRRRQ